MAKVSEEQNINIDISQTDPVICKECGNDTFLQVFYMRKVSAVIAGQESLWPVPVFECARCGTVDDIFKPQTTDGTV